MNHITLSEAAKQVNLSPSYVSRSFKQIVGVNFNNYLRGTRRKHAERMLIQSDLSIRRISELCGFNDYFYFEKVFKKDTGLVPSAYREKYKDTTH